MKTSFEYDEERGISVKKKYWLIPLLTIVIVAGLWFGEYSIIPRQIAGTVYVKEHFPEMKLQCVGVNSADSYGNFTIILWDRRDSTYYPCLIGPKYFPVSIGEGLSAIESDYVEKYK